VHLSMHCAKGSTRSRRFMLAADLPFRAQNTAIQKQCLEGKRTAPEQDSSITGASG
jgi:hypothetical protein